MIELMYSNPVVAAAMLIAVAIAIIVMIYLGNVAFSGKK